VLVVASECKSDTSDVGEREYDTGAFGCGGGSAAPRPIAVVARRRKIESGKVSFMVA
jgi:hypothetical protein